MSRLIRSLGLPLVILLGLVVLGGVALLGSMASEGGSRWLIRQVLTHTGGVLTVGGVRGRLLGRLELTDIDYALAEARGHVDRVVLEWRPARLLGGTLDVRALHVHGVEHVQTGETEGRFEPPQSLPLPLRVSVHDLWIDGASIQQGTEYLVLDTLRLGVHADPQQGLELRHGRLQAQGADLELSGRVGPAMPYPYTAQLSWRATAGEGMEASGQVALHGDLHALELEHRLTSPFAVQTEGRIALDPEAPRFDLSGAWQAARWPLSGEAQWQSERGEYHIKGAIDAYRYALQGGLTGARIPEMQIQAQGQGGRQGLSIAPLEIAALGGRIRSEGTLSWSPQLDASFRVQASDIDPGRAWPEWPGSLSGVARLRGRIQDSVASLHLDEVDLKGKIRDRPVGLQGGLSLEGETLSIERILVRSGANQLSVTGTWGQELDLEAELKAPDLAGLWPGLAGRLQGDVQLKGTLDRPVGRLRLSGQDLDYAGYRAQALRAELILAASPQRSRATLRLEDLVLQGQSLSRVQVQGRGWMDRHRLVLTAAAPQAETRIALEGGYAAGVWKALIDTADLDLRDYGVWRLRGPASIRLAGEGLSPFETCWVSAQAGACVQGQWVYPRGWDVQADLKDYPLARLRRLWTLPLSVEGGLSVQAKAADTGAGMTARLQIRSGTGTLRYEPEGEHPYTSHYQDAGLVVDYAHDTARAHASVRLDDGRLQGTLEIARVLAPSNGRPVQGEVHAVFPDIRFLNALLPDLGLERGAVEVNAALAGRLEAPRITGRAVLSDAAVNVPELGLTVTGIRLSALAKGGERIELSGGLRSGSGEISMTGHLVPAPRRHWPFVLRIQGKAVEVAQLPEVHALASPDLRIEGDAQRIAITGTLRIPKARIEIKKLPETAVPVSSDQVIVGTEGHATGPSRSPAPKITVKITLELGDDVRFQGLGLTTELGGLVQLRGEPPKPLAANGVLVLKAGRYEGYGQKLAIERGRLLFAGPMDNPGLDIRATRTSGDVVAGIEITGTLESPETHLFSDPAMSEAEALSYLVTGKPLSGSESSDSQAMAAAALALGVNNPLSQGISEALGVDVGIKSGETDADTAVQVGKQISPRLYVDYAYGVFNEIATLEFIYKLSKHFRLTGESGPRQSIELEYTLDTD
jgi:translocation and assembly module TamB